MTPASRRTFLLGAAGGAAAAAFASGFPRTRGETFVANSATWPRLVVTGDLGNIGSQLRGYGVKIDVGIDKKRGDHEDLAVHNGPWEGLLRQGDVVLHLAAHASPLATDEEVKRDNVWATLNLVTACAVAKASRIIFASSTWADPQAYPETTLGRSTGYGRSKLWAENFLRAAASINEYPLDATAVRIGVATPASGVLLDDRLRPFLMGPAELREHLVELPMKDPAGFTLDEPFRPHRMTTRRG